MDHKQTPRPGSTAADTYRRFAAEHDRDLEAEGVRPDGPLGWDPPDAIEYREHAVAVARRRALARRRISAIERQRRERREIRAFWREVA